MKRWPTQFLGEVTQVAAGDPAPQRPEDFSDDGFPFVRMQDVGRFGQTANLTETKDRVSVSASSKLKRFPVGSILVPKSGASIRLNHRAILGVEAHVVSHLAVIVPKASLKPRFVFYWLCGIDLSGAAHDADLPSMKTSELAKLQIPVPPLAEQERIVKLLDEADELRKIRAQADSRTAALLPALFNEMFGDPEKNQHGWPTSPLGWHIDFLTGFPFKSGEYVDSVNSVRLCRGANVLPQRIDWSDVRHWPISRVSEVNQYELREGDIILAMDRPWISDGLKVARLSIADLPCVLVQRVARIRPKPTLVAEFIYQSLCHPAFAAHCNLVKTETTVPHISPHSIRSFIVPIPPLPLQQEFAQRVTEIRELKATQAASHQRLESVFQSMLHGAFNGEL
jgi:type I restriction enzyme S subunit